MNPNYTHTITLYNCFRAADNPNSTKDIWYKTVLHHCFYKSVISRSEYVSGSPKVDNAYSVRIPRSVQYKPYVEWAQLSEEERKQFFTCSQKDIAVHGECAEVVTGLAPDTASQILTRQKPDAFIVTAFADNTFHVCAKHYRLGG